MSSVLEPHPSSHFKTRQNLNQVAMNLCFHEQMSICFCFTPVPISVIIFYQIVWCNCISCMCHFWTVIRCTVQTMILWLVLALGINVHPRWIAILASLHLSTVNHPSHSVLHFHHPSTSCWNHCLLVILTFLLTAQPIVTNIYSGLIQFYHFLKWVLLNPVPLRSSYIF